MVMVHDAVVDHVVMAVMNRRGGGHAGCQGHGDGGD